MFPEKWTGIFPPIVTPLDDDERLDEAGFERQLERLLDAGVHGVYLLGSSGEWVALREDVRLHVIRTAVKLVAGRVPVISCIMDTSTERVLDNARRVRDLGVDAFATTPPYYYSPFNNDDIVSFFETVAEDAGLPVFIYNIPGTTKVMIPAEVVGRLSRHDNIVGTKDSSGNWNQAIELLECCGGRSDFSIFLGSHVLAGGAILFGADGAVMSLVNLDPTACLELFESARKGDVKGVHRAQLRLLKLGRIYQYGREIPCLKTALELMGVCGHRTTHPLMPLTPAARENVAAILRSLGLI